MILYIAFLGAAINKIRGGVLTDLLWSFGRLIGKDWENKEGKRKEALEVPFVKPLHDLTFAGIFTFIISGGFLYTKDALYIFIALFSASMLGNRQGWGSYIAGIITGVIATKIRSQIKWIDKLVFVAPSYPVLRNCLAFGLRGLMWTVPLALAFWICSLLGFYIAPTFVWIVPLGFFIGLPYVFAAKNTSEPWAFGELFWGFILWGACVALI